MKRRNFLELVMAGSGATAASLIPGSSAIANSNMSQRLSGKQKNRTELQADLVIAGGGLGGCAAALAALRNGLRVIMTEETDWIGGQVTQQGLSCFDEHPWIETYGATQLYRNLRQAIRQYYRLHYPLISEAKDRKYLNPGDGSVSRLCHEPRVALAVLQAMFAPYLSSGHLILLLEHKVTGAEISGDQVQALTAQCTLDKRKCVLQAPYFVDATELGELLPLTKTEYVTGAESRSQTQELHAAEQANTQNNQAYTFCFAMDYIPGSNHIIQKPEEYDFWKKYIPKMSPSWPGHLLSLQYSTPSTKEPKDLGFQPDGEKTGSKLNLWNYRRIIHKENFKEGFYDGSISIVNWPQNDYFLGNLIDVSEAEFDKNIQRAKQLSLSLFYWLQTEVPRPDGKQGWQGLRLRPDIVGTEDGLAKYPYIRESRRIRALFTILEEHVGAENRALVTGKKSDNKAAYFYDSVGVGSYHIDLHPTCTGNNYIDFDSLPFQIPLGALLPERVNNLVAANKNIGTTHITNGCYRLHPVEWNIGEAAGSIVAYAIRKKAILKQIREDKSLLKDFQVFIRSQGIETHWPSANF